MEGAPHLIDGNILQDDECSVSVTRIFLNIFWWGLFNRCPFWVGAEGVTAQNFARMRMQRMFTSLVGVRSVVRAGNIFLNIFLFGGHERLKVS